MALSLLSNDPFKFKLDDGTAAALGGMGSGSSAKPDPGLAHYQGIMADMEAMRQQLVDGLVQKPGTRSTAPAPAPKTRTGSTTKSSMVAPDVTGSDRFRLFGKIDGRAPQAAPPEGLTGGKGLTDQSSWDKNFRNTATNNFGASDSTSYAGMKKPPGWTPSTGTTAESRADALAQKTNAALNPGRTQSQAPAGVGSNASIVSRYGIATNSKSLASAVTPNLATPFRPEDVAPGNELPARPGMAELEAALKSSLQDRGLSADGSLQARPSMADTEASLRAGMQGGTVDNTLSASPMTDMRGATTRLKGMLRTPGVSPSDAVLSNYNDGMDRTENQVDKAVLQLDTDTHPVFATDIIASRQL